MGVDLNALFSGMNAHYEKRGEPVPKHAIVPAAFTPEWNGEEVRLDDYFLKPTLSKNLTTALAAGMVKFFYLN